MSKNEELKFINDLFKFLTGEYVEKWNDSDRRLQTPLSKKEAFKVLFFLQEFEDSEVFDKDYELCGCCGEIISGDHCCFSEVNPQTGKIDNEYSKKFDTIDKLQTEHVCDDCINNFLCEAD